ncbi:pyrroline-5-carboxylate reductase [Opitutales bacterium ASA1]|uniref:pyrroline-5-carboxylate reductase n=1 Tax=Congregicoccus parvus TaxID=3081749 RepID=UPI002B2EA124|nr:pyrroline-5-carboxylate reductase [Opitutales bacterium ASA1]
MTRWAFLGAGAMAGAMVRGLLSSGRAKPSDIVCIGGADPTAVNLARATGIEVAADFATLLTSADVLVLACKPQNLADLPDELATLTSGRLVVSIIAGKRLETLHRRFPHARNLVRVMPNTPGQIGTGISGWCAHDPLTDADERTLLQLLHALGKAVAVSEPDMDAVTAVSGSGPAYVFEFAAALREAGIHAGLEPATATLLAQETLLGAARLLAESHDTAETLRDRVTSPNGTTYAALQVLLAHDFRGLFREAVAAATKRSRELSVDS